MRTSISLKTSVQWRSKANHTHSQSVRRQDTWRDLSRTRRINKNDKSMVWQIKRAREREEKTKIWKDDTRKSRGEQWRFVFASLINENLRWLVDSSGSNHAKQTRRIRGNFSRSLSILHSHRVVLWLVHCHDFSPVRLVLHISRTGVDDFCQWISNKYLPFSTIRSVAEA